MTEIFLHIVNMSITASILAVIVLILRLLLKKAPKWMSVLLWGLVALRLICPFAVESPFSLIPKTEWIMDESSISADETYFDSVPPDSIPAIDFSLLGEDVTVHYYPIENPEIEIHRGISISFILSCVWIAGMAALLLHTVISTVRLRRSIGAAIRVQNNVWESSAVESPFVLGVIRPKIYIPRGMTEEKLAYVIAHEQAHICRHDHWWKPFGFILLTIHWFNPVMWLAYILLCRDIEMACDERVVRDMGEVERADYSEALLECSVKRSMISACPLAFGEVGVKERIKTVLNYKKPAFWIIVLALIASIVTAVCFLTNPSSVDADLQIFIDGRIAEHHQSPYASEHACVLDWELLGKEKNGDEITLYMWVLYEEYSFENGALQKETTAHIPTVITAKNVSGGYRLVEYWEPGDGTKYASDIRSKVPWYLYGKMTDSQRYISKQKSACQKLAEEYFADKQNDGLPDTGDTIENIIASNIAEETLTYWVLKGHQEEIWAYRNTAINDTVDGTFRKWGERIAAVGVNDERNCVDVYVYDFDEGDIGRFKKALGHLSYVLIQKDDVIEMIPDEKKQLTLEDVIELSAKGQDLSWEDFEAFNFKETGSGLYIRLYEIDEIFELWIGGGSPVSTPMYIYLSANGIDNRIDIRNGGVEEFISQYRSSALSDTAMLNDRPISYYVELAFEAAQFLADSKGVTISKEKYNLRHDHDGSNIWVQFYGLTEEGWDDKFVEVALVRNENGDYDVSEDNAVIKSNSEQIKSTSLIVIGNHFESIEENMQANPSLANKESLPSISAYEKIFVYGEELVLEYIFSEFLTGKHTDLHGDVMMWVMLDLLNENEIIAYDAENGQDYFDHWLVSARSVGKQHDVVWLEVNVPSIALVLRMTGDISSETYVDQTEVDPDPADTAISRVLNQHYRDDEPTGLLHGISYVLLANETVSGTPRFGQTNHMEKEIYYLLVMHQKYSMQNGQLQAVGGSYIPTVLTFTKEDNGDYILDEYWEPRDGAYYDDDIKAKFPAGVIEEVWNMDAYSDKLENQCADDVFVYVDNYQTYTEPGDF